MQSGNGIGHRIGLTVWQTFVSILFKGGVDYLHQTFGRVAATSVDISVVNGVGIPTAFASNYFVHRRFIGEPSGECQLFSKLDRSFLCDRLLVHACRSDHGRSRRVTPYRLRLNHARDHSGGGAGGADRDDGHGLRHCDAGP